MLYSVPLSTSIIDSPVDPSLQGTPVSLVKTRASLQNIERLAEKHVAKQMNALAAEDMRHHFLGPMRIDDYISTFFGDRPDCEDLRETFKELETDFEKFEDGMKEPLMSRLMVCMSYRPSLSVTYTRL